MTIVRPVLDVPFLAPLFFQPASIHRRLFRSPSTSARFWSGTPALNSVEDLTSDQKPRKKKIKRTTDRLRTIPNHTTTNKSGKRGDAEQFKSSPNPFGTMTDGELDAFAKLFRSLGTQHKSKQQENHDEQDLRPTLVKDADILGEVHTDHRVDGILARELKRQESQISRYPDAIREMAVAARLQLTRDKLLEQRKFDQADLTADADQEIARVWRLMVDARSDLEVGKVLEEEIFASFRAVALNKSDEQISKPSEDSTNTPSTPSQRKDDLALLALTYPYNLYNAAQILCSRTTYTPLATSIIPTCKSLGTLSYTLGISTGLYNILLDYGWRVLNDLNIMLTMLHDMDEAALTLDSGTWEVLDGVTLYHHRARRGDFGEGVRAMESMSERARQVKKMWYWKREIRQRTESMALETANRKVLEDEFREANIPSLPAGLPSPRAGPYLASTAI